MRHPHPIPYQGSKRNLASAILAIVAGRAVERLYEPFAGSAAITIAAASTRVSVEHIIADSLDPLIALWSRILSAPSDLADAYERVWKGHERGGDDYYTRVRERFNAKRDPADLLYLLARCVKNSPRWNRDGHFNQSADLRRLGMQPTKMRRELIGAHDVLRGRTTAIAGDFEQTIADARPCDLVYMDPPYEGTSGSRDTRYHQGLARERLIVALDDLNRRDVPWLLSYDGRCGEKTYGSPLPKELGATRLEIDAGRSSQATLNGHAATTFESLYVSQNLVGTRLSTAKPQLTFSAVA